MAWKREGDFLIEYDSNGKPTGNKQDMSSNQYDWKKGTILSYYGDGYRSNNTFRRGSMEEVRKAYEIFLNTGKMPTAVELGVNEGPYKNILRDVQTMAFKNGIDFEKYQEEKAVETDTLNPYTAYLEQQRIRQEGAELGLLNTQTQANLQNAEITAQQGFMQQAQFKDQLIEQIKTDRLSKMRSGLTPMQIAQEDLQFMVGNMQTNNQQMQLVNQQRLMATQQKNMNPYQAFINSQATVTGQQGYVNAASGFAATDAGDLNQQALRLRNNLNKGYINRNDLKTVQDPNWK